MPQSFSDLHLLVVWSRLRLSRGSGVRQRRTLGPRGACGGASLFTCLEKHHDFGEFPNMYDVPADSEHVQDHVEHNPAEPERDREESQRDEHEDEEDVDGAAPSVPECVLAESFRHLKGPRRMKGSGIQMDIPMMLKKR